MSGLTTAGVNLDKGEVFKVLETNIQRDRARLREEAWKEGRLEGRVEGRVEGRIEGMQAVARRMASMGEEIAKIALITGLSEEEIKSLSNGSECDK